MPIRKYPKNRLKEGAEFLLPQEQAPSLKNPSRSAFIGRGYKDAVILNKEIPDPNGSGI